jgi:hypothetical protein
MRDRLIWLGWFVGLLLWLLLLGYVLAGLFVPTYARAACFYDPLHQVCTDYPPAYPPPGYPQVCSGGYYDAAHGICQSYPPAYPIPPYYGGQVG